MAQPLALVMAWMAASPKDAYPPGLFVLGSRVGVQTLYASEYAIDTWRALRGTCRDLRKERGLRNLELARDYALDNLIQFEEWEQLARLGL